MKWINKYNLFLDDIKEIEYQRFHDHPIHLHLSFFPLRFGKLFMFWSFLDVITFFFLKAFTLKRTLHFHSIIQLRVWILRLSPSWRSYDFIFLQFFLGTWALFFPFYCFLKKKIIINSPIKTHPCETEKNNPRPVNQSSIL